MYSEDVPPSVMRFAKQRARLLVSKRPVKAAPRPPKAKPLPFRPPRGGVTTISNTLQPFLAAEHREAEDLVPIREDIEFKVSLAQLTKSQRGGEWALTGLRHHPQAPEAADARRDRAG
jgi:hypothetical protein